MLVDEHVHTPHTHTFTISGEGILTNEWPCAVCSKEDVEKCKQRDLLEQLLKEMTGEFPALSRVFVDERDVFLAHSLKIAARPREYHEVPEGNDTSVLYMCWWGWKVIGRESVCELVVS